VEYVTNEIRRHRLAALLISLLLVLGVVTVFYLSYFSRATQPTIDSVAVLPFTNATADSESEYLSDGLTESLINSLSQITNLRVMSRSSVFRYKGREPDVQSVGRELGVGAVLIGRVAQRGDNLSISVELVDVKDGSHLWGDQYNRKLTEVLTTQQEIAGGIANGLRLKLTGEDRTHLTKQYTQNPEAYQAYLRGRYLLNKYTEDSYKKSLEHFNRSIELDPSFALAFAGVADAYIVASDWYISVKDALPKARVAASRALEIDDSLAEAHNSLAWISMTYGDLVGGEREFKRAIELKPNYAFAHESYSIYLTVAQRHSEAVNEAKRARELDPLSPSANLRVGAALGEMRHYDEAISELQRAIEVDLNYWWPRVVLGETYVRQGRFAEAIAEFQKARKLDNNPFILGRLGHAYAQTGNKEQAMQTLDELKALAGKRYVPPESVACVYIGLGERNQALDWLQRAWEDRSFALFFLYAPMWDSLRSEPRFNEIERQVRLPHN
jgi:TolB-like protein/Flp pilus assembly protein TadD